MIFKTALFCWAAFMVAIWFGANRDLPAKTPTTAEEIAKNGCIARGVAFMEDFGVKDSYSNKRDAAERMCGTGVLR